MGQKLTNLIMNLSISLKSIRYTSIPVLSFRHFVVPSKDLGSFRSKDKLPYARPYKPRLVYFYPTFHSGLCCRAVSIADNLCTKQGNPLIFEPKIRNL